MSARRGLTSIAVGAYRLLLEQQARNAGSQLRAAAVLGEATLPRTVAYYGSKAALRPQPWPAAASALQQQLHLFHTAGPLWQQVQPTQQPEQVAPPPPKPEAQAASGAEPKPVPPSLPDAGAQGLALGRVSFSSLLCTQVAVRQAILYPNRVREWGVGGRRTLRPPKCSPLGSRMRFAAALKPSLHMYNAGLFACIL